MRSTLPDSIEVSITREGARYRLPVRPQYAVIGMVYVAAGGLATVAAPTWGLRSFAQADVMPLLLQVVLSLAPLPLTLLALVYGLWMLVGYDEVEVAEGFSKARAG